MDCWYSDIEFLKSLKNVSKMATLSKSEFSISIESLPILPPFRSSKVKPLEAFGRMNSVNLELKDAI